MAAKCENPVEEGRKEEATEGVYGDEGFREAFETRVFFAGP